MTTNKSMQTIQDNTLTMNPLGLPVNAISEELSDLELGTVAGGTGMTTQNPLYQHFAEEAKKLGPVVNFKFQMATAVPLMAGKSASLRRGAIATNPAPAEMPNTKGSANPFRNMPWSSAPDKPKAAPTTNAATIRGRCNSQIMV
jgi:hypothetical protein